MDVAAKFITPGFILLLTMMVGFWLSTMGKTMMWIGGLFIPVAKESVEMMYEFDQPFIVDSGKFEKTFGMKATPMKEAIKETVAWYKNHP